ncbi:FMN-binding protein [Clostridium fallax]|uniref:Major membrane immunogen, membrane-anchored lipoprotein n=1 Tax=Clostridium fallax TaxID=1533 RepID=A0A1M4WH55_9CLOT|nr:FMN-binding protein [Clostridium fallax]SHE80403.1 Major membrane immunogen, membrane-anchored lipoprotein [Clostridium fallax]SQB04959.1 lipoprotein [Clostridium fallax]
MKKRLISVILLSSLAFATILSGCGNKDAASSNSSELKNGTYKVEAKDFDDKGWKQFAEIEVKDGKIVKAEYDSVNKKDSKLLKSQDKSYEEMMKSKTGTSPSEFSKTLSEELVKTQEVSKVEAVSGATHSSDDFKKLAQQAIDNAKKGDTAVTTIELNK